MLKHEGRPVHLANMKARFQQPMTLQDVVKIVSQFSRNDHETAIVVADLLNRGLVRVRGNFTTRRIVVR
jgi:hypothetical protein